MIYELITDNECTETHISTYTRDVESGFLRKKKSNLKKNRKKIIVQKIPFSSANKNSDDNENCDEYYDRDKERNSPFLMRLICRKLWREYQGRVNLLGGILNNKMIELYPLIIESFIISHESLNVLNCESFLCENKWAFSKLKGNMFLP